MRPGGASELTSLDEDDIKWCTLHQEMHNPVRQLSEAHKLAADPTL